MAARWDQDDRQAAGLPTDSTYAEGIVPDPLLELDGVVSEGAAEALGVVGLAGGTVAGGVTAGKVISPCTASPGPTTTEPVMTIFVPDLLTDVAVSVQEPDRPAMAMVAPVPSGVVELIVAMVASEVAQTGMSSGGTVLPSAS